MRKTLIIILIFALTLTLYLMINNSFSSKDKTRPATDNATEINRRIGTNAANKKNKLTMKQIDSVSASLNYKFTKNNRVVDSISANKVEDPKKAEIKGGK